MKYIGLSKAIFSILSICLLATLIVRLQFSPSIFRTKEWSNSIHHRILAATTNHIAEVSLKLPDNNTNKPATNYIAEVSLISPNQRDGNTKTASLSKAKPNNIHPATPDKQKYEIKENTKKGTLHNKLPSLVSTKSSSKIEDLGERGTGKILKCYNQSSCIQPKLLLQKVYNVYYCKHVGYGVRFYYLVREGLLLHPNIRLVSDPYVADIIVYLPVSMDWDKSECKNPLFRNKTMVLDEGDYPQLFDPPATKNKDNFILYFKRSYVRRHHGHFEGYMGYLHREEIFPMTYTIMEAYIRTTFNRHRDRPFDIVSTLRGGPGDPARDRAVKWVMEYGKSRELKKWVAGQVNHESRTVISGGYFKSMYEAKIIVTANPSGWEGDFRLMEAIATGSLIFVDYMYVPRPSPLIENKHIVYYQNNNKTDLFSKLDYYRNNPDIARIVAVMGYLHAMTHHRAANLIDYAFRTLHLKQLRQQHHLDKNDQFVSSTLQELEKHYQTTGYDTQEEARRHARVLEAKKVKKPKN